MAKLGDRLETHDVPYIPNLFPNDKRSKADRGASIDDVTSYIYLSLVDFQGKFIQDKNNSWWVTFLNAWKLTIGSSIQNITSGETYIINQFVDKAKKKVELRGVVPPTRSDILELSEKDLVRFVPAFSSEEQELADWRDTITYKVSRREPGVVTGKPFGSPQEIKPRLREELPDPENPRHHIFIQGWWFDNLIQFDCWARTNQEADKLISWFEDFVLKYTWVWKKNGVQEILYWSRGRDETITRWRNDIVNRTLLYYFRTEKIIVTRTQDYTQIDLKISLTSRKEVDVVPSIRPSGITEFTDQGLVIK